MNKVSAAHIRAVEAVNNAKTEAEHQSAERFLRIFRECLEATFDGTSGYGYALMDCDKHYLDQGIDRPMCGGVFLDWKPL